MLAHLLDQPVCRGSFRRITIVSGRRWLYPCSLVRWTAPAWDHRSGPLGGGTISIAIWRQIDHIVCCHPAVIRATRAGLQRWAVDSRSIGVLGRSDGGQRHCNGCTRSRDGRILSEVSETVTGWPSTQSMPWQMKGQRVAESDPAGADGRRCVHLASFMCVLTGKSAFL